MEMIDRNALLEKSFNTGYEYGEINVVGTTHIEEAPAIDSVHAAGACYCRECKKFYSDGNFCGQHQSAVESADFCSYGEKMEIEAVTGAVVANGGQSKSLKA